jgi:hypothetical protein
MMMRESVGNDLHQKKAHSMETTGLRNSGEGEVFKQIQNGSLSERKISKL